MSNKEFRSWIDGPRPPFAKRIRMSEAEFKKHIEESFGVRLNDSSNKQFAQKIFQLRRFYFKITV